MCVWETAAHALARAYNLKQSLWRSVGMDGDGWTCCVWRGWWMAGCSALAGTQPMRSCDTVQIFPSSSSSRYATLCCAVLYICVLFCFSGYPQKKNTKVSPLVTVTVTTIPAVVYFSTLYAPATLTKTPLTLPGTDFDARGGIRAHNHLLRTD